MALLTTQFPNVQGVLTNDAASAGGDTYANNARTLLLANCSDQPRTITITAQRTKVTVPAFGPLDVEDLVITTSTLGWMAIQASPGAYNDGTTGEVTVTADDETSVGYAVVRLANVS